MNDLEEMLDLITALVIPADTDATELLAELADTLRTQRTVVETADAAIKTASAPHRDALKAIKSEHTTDETNLATALVERIRVVVTEHLEAIGSRRDELLEAATRAAAEGRYDEHARLIAAAPSYPRVPGLVIAELWAPRVDDAELVPRALCVPDVAAIDAAQSAGAIVPGCSRARMVRVAFREPRS
jgi:hypothetical protein